MTESILIPKRVADVLNDYQYATIKERLEQAEAERPLLLSILKRLCQEHASDEALREELIEDIVIPYNRNKLNRMIEGRIDKGGHEIIQVVGDEEEAGFAYTLGLYPQVKTELLVIGNLPQQVSGTILNNLAEIVKKNPEVDTLPDDFITLSDGRVGRTRLERKPFSLVLDHYTMWTTDWFDVDHKDEVLVLRLPDPNNRLPGEFGYQETIMGRAKI